MSSSNYAPSQNDSSDPEMPDLITDQDFPDPEPNETTEAFSSVLTSSATEFTSEEILDSFSCKTLEATVTVSLAKVSLSPTNKDPIASSSEATQSDVDSPIFIGACITPGYHPFSWYKGKYPKCLTGLPFGEPLITGRSFSLSQLDLMDDAAVEAYRSIRKDCTPIPAGFWIEFECLDFLLDFMLKNFEASLPNEEWIHRHLAEGSHPLTILKRFSLTLIHEFSIPFFLNVLLF